MPQSQECSNQESSTRWQPKLDNLKGKVKQVRRGLHRIVYKAQPVQVCLNADESKSGVQIMPDVPMTDTNCGPVPVTWESKRERNEYAKRNNMHFW